MVRQHVAHVLAEKALYALAELLHAITRPHTCRKERIGSTVTGLSAGSRISRVMALRTYGPDRVDSLILLLRELRYASAGEARRMATARPRGPLREPR